MKLPLPTHAFPVILFQVAACLAPLPLLSAPRPVIVNVPDTALPPIWRNVSASERLSLVRAAELDATRLLAERISGVKINEDSVSKDLTAADDRIRAEMQASITGVKTTEGPTYTVDGRVEVVRQVNIEQLINKIEERYSNRGSRSTSSNSNTLTEKRKVVFDALGSAAIRGSEGQRRLLAKRAAEVDAYRRLVERVGNTPITSTTNTAAFMAQNDVVKTAVVDAVKNAETTQIEFSIENNKMTASVTMRLALGPIVRVVTRQFKNGESTLISDKTEELTLEETGSGTATDGEEVQVDVTIDNIVEQTLSEKGGLR